MEAAILATVFLGFARSYFLAGVFHAPLPNLLIHVHGAVFSCWMILLIAQTSLVSAGRVDLHRKLGTIGGALAVAMIVLGLLASTDSMARGFSPSGSGIDPKTFYAIGFLQIVTFAVLVVAALRARSDPAAHKRLMLIATISLLGPAVNRWPFAIIHKIPPLSSLVLAVLVLMLVGFDLWSRHRVHRATIWGGFLLIVSQFVMFPIGLSSFWHSFAAWVLRIWTASR
jgi:hypothetical protein